MLEQNTDRIYWVIGALIVGAIVIGGAQLIFPDLIKDVLGKMNEFLTGVDLPKVTE